MSVEAVWCRVVDAAIVGSESAPWCGIGALDVSSGDCE